MATQAAAHELARSEASTSEHGAEQQGYGWWAQLQARHALRTATGGGIAKPKDERPATGGHS